MSHWLLKSITEVREQALKQINGTYLFENNFPLSDQKDCKLIQEVAEVLKIAVFDLLMEDIADNKEKQDELKLAANDAFLLSCSLPQPRDPIDAGMFLLYIGSLAIIGDKHNDALQWIKTQKLPVLPIHSKDWNQRTKAMVIDSWIHLVFQNSKANHHLVLNKMSELRNSQSEYTKSCVSAGSWDIKEATYLELAALYHLAAAAEKLAYYLVNMTNNEIADKKHEIVQALKLQFICINSICDQAKVLNIKPLSMLLEAIALQIIQDKT